MCASRYPTFVWRIAPFRDTAKGGKQGDTIKGVLLRVAAISFLNPAPLLYDFEHEPWAGELRTRYDVHYTLPSRCAAQLHAGEVDLGLIPIAELTPELRIIPGCAIASLGEVRSILLLVRMQGGLAQNEALKAVRTIAADSASRSSVAYVRVILQRFYGVTPEMREAAADPLAMLAEHDAALLIGDPALLARERRAEIDAKVALGSETLLWIDVARLWREHTRLPWVAAVWAARPGMFAPAGITAEQVILDLNCSRDRGLATWSSSSGNGAGACRFRPTRSAHTSRKIFTISSTSPAWKACSYFGTTRPTWGYYRRLEACVTWMSDRGSFMCRS